MFRQIFALGIALFFLLWLSGQSARAAEIEVDPLAADPAIYFTDNMTSTGVSEVITPLEQALLDRINGASIAIDAAFYDFNRTSIQQALIAAFERGVIVRIVTDDETRFHNDSYIPFYDGLEEAGIVVKDDDLGSSIMHNKYFIIDGETLWTGSTNVTNNGFTKNHNNALVFQSTEIADFYQIDFNQMWAGLFSTAKTDPLSATVTYSGHPVDLYFSPTEDAIDAVIAQVNAATESIDFAIFFFTDDDLRDALIAAQDRGVRIRGLWDQLGSANSFSEDETLCDAGITIKVEDTIGKMHHKFMVVDADTLTPRTITGSMNWTGAGNARNNENTVVLHDPAVAQSFKGGFEAMWDGSGPETTCRTFSQTYIPLMLETTSPIIQIRRIVYNPEGDDVSGELVQFRNVGGTAQDLAGWTLRDVAENTYTFPSIILQPGATLTLWTREGDDTADSLYWGRSGSAIWNNGGDTASLFNTDGSLIDRCAYPGGAVEIICKP